MFNVSDTWITLRIRKPFECTQTPSHFILLYTHILSFLSSCTQPPSYFIEFYTTMLSFYSILHIHPLITLRCSFYLRISLNCIHPSSHFQASSQNCEKRQLRHVYVSVCLSVRLSVHMENLVYHWTDCHDVLYLRIFKESVEKIKFNLYSSCVLPSRTAFNLYRTKVTYAVTQVKV
jgi:hypothetical protein